MCKGMALAGLASMVWVGGWVRVHVHKCECLRMRVSSGFAI